MHAMHKHTCMHNTGVTQTLAVTHTVPPPLPPPPAVCVQVSVELVMKTFKANACKATELLLAVIPRIAAEDWADTLAELQVRVHYHSQRQRACTANSVMVLTLFIPSIPNNNVFMVCCYGMG